LQYEAERKQREEVRKEKDNKESERITVVDNFGRSIYM